MIRIHNSLTGEKQALQPIEPGHVRMYVCGMTIYDFLHVGHARMLTVFDLVTRYLRHRGLRVTYVRNITDIDDKIIARAAENGEPIEALTERFIRSMNEDCAALGILRPDFEPRVTQYLPNIIQMIEALITRGYAYTVADGDVLYAVAKFKGYGKLSGKRLADLRAGARVEVDTEKRDPLDFVLWKHAKPGEPAWDSPWGPGRPGWHIECSAMSTALLGTHFDLHGGGMDLKFPHHENEIAQSCAATGDRFADVWIHNGFVNVANEKMSKSLGNFFTVREVIPRLRHPEVLRYFLLSSHYRGPISYSPEQLEQADAALGRIYIALRELPASPQPARPDAEHASGSDHSERFHQVMDDDFNTPEAIAVLQSLTREINTAKATGRLEHATSLGGQLRSLSAVLGLGQVDPAIWFRSSSSLESGESNMEAIDDATVDALMQARRAARAAKDWRESDRIRDELTGAGIILEDQPGGGSTWRRA